MQQVSPHTSGARGKACTVWLTGLSGAGKSTLGQALAGYLTGHSLSCVLIDGDDIRHDLCRDLGFSKQNRDENVRRIGSVARLLNSQGVFCIVAAISPYRQGREQVRAKIDRFLEVYVDCPIEALIDRDVKGFYMQALTGELANFSGVSDPYERPLDPEVYINTDVQSKQESLGAIVSKLKTTGWIPETDPAPVGALQPAILRILLALLFVASAIAANWTFEFNSGLWPFFVLAAAVAASTVLLGLAEGVASAGFAAIAADYLYVAPAFTFSLDSLSLRFALICLTLAAVTYWIGQRAQNRVRVRLS